MFVLFLAACSPPTYTLGRETIASTQPFDKPILLTIDDGPENGAVDADILATLARHKARAIWFVNCRNFGNPANVATLRKIIDAGHMIGNHGYSHLRLDKLHGEALRHEIEGCSEAIGKATGQRPRFYRPAFGLTTPEAEAEIARSGMEPVLWSLNTYDTLLPSFKHDPNAYCAWLAHWKMGEAPGDVLLMHDYPHTARNLDAMLSRLEGEGFHFVLPTRR